MSDIDNGNGEDLEREILFVEPRDPSVVHPPTELQGPAWQSRFIFNPNQPPPPVLATRFFPPPPWPENLEGDNLTIMPVVGPFLSLTEEQMETPPGFGRFPPGSQFEGLFAEAPYRRERRLARRQGIEAREERREERMEDRLEERTERRRRGRPRREPLESDTRERPTSDWPSGGGAE